MRNNKFLKRLRKKAKKGLRGYLAPPDPGTGHLLGGYSMTSSARARIDGGIVRPSSLAVFRLTDN